jgi:hypothetical protein
MARLKCAACGHRVNSADVVCRACGHPLLDDGAVVADDVTAVTPEPDPPASEPLTEVEPVRLSSPPAVPAAGACPHCGAPVPDPQNLVCVVCLKELGPSPAGSTVTGTSYATTREPTAEAMDLRFRALTVTVRPGEQATLGRDMFGTGEQARDRYDNVSRRHATVGLRPDGTAWVRDEGSTNGTYVDGRMIGEDTVVDLGPGSELRLASNVTATVRLPGSTS